MGVRENAPENPASSLKFPNSSGGSTRRWEVVAVAAPTLTPTLTPTPTLTLVLALPPAPELASSFLTNPTAPNTTSALVEAAVTLALAAPDSRANKRIGN